jgi:uncharacterized protein with beta-barrel porin domain
MLVLAGTALAGVALFPSAALAQSIWGGAGGTTTTSDYNTGTNWSTNPVAPTASGSSAQFGNGTGGSGGTASTSVNVSAPVAPNSWTFLANSQSYTVTGSAVSFGNAATLTNNASAGQAISIANNMTGTTLSQAAASTLTISGTNSFTTTTISGGTLANNGSLTSAVGTTVAGTFTNNLTVTGSVTNAGTFTDNIGSSVSAGLTNTGTGTNAGTINGGVGNSGTFGNTGTVNNGLSNTAGTATNSATINNGVNVSGGTFTQTAGTVSGGLSNTATVNANGGAINGGIINNSGGAFTVGGTVTANGTFTNNNTAALGVTGGNFTGISTLTNNSTNANGIVVATGKTLSATNISNSAGAFIQNSGTLTATTGPVGNAGTLNNLLSTSIINGGLSNTAGTTTNTGTINGGVTVTGGTLNTNTATSIVNGGLTNSAGNPATVNAAGQVNGVIVNQSFGSFTVSGALVGNSTFTNSGIANLAVTGGDFTGITTLTNSSANPSAISIAANRTLSAVQINNNTGAVIQNSGTLGAGGIVNTGGTINSLLAGSVINLGSGGAGLGNFGTAFVNAQGQINGGPIVNNDTSAFTVTGNLAGDGIKTSFTNYNTADLNVTGGNFIGITTLTNSSSNALGGVVIAAGKTLSAITVNNTAGAIFNNSGTLTAGTGGIANSGTITSTGFINVGSGLTNSGSGVINAQVAISGGPISNIGNSTFNVTNALAGDGTNTSFTNNGTAQLSVTGGNFTGITTLTNNSTNANGIVVATGKTLSATNVSNSAGAFIQNSGTLTATTGPVVNAGTLNNLLSTSIVNGGLSNTAGTTANTGTINGGVTVTGGTLNSNTATSIVNGGLTNSATVNAQNQVNGAIINQGAGIFTVSGTLAGNNNAFDNNDTARLIVSGGDFTGINRLDNFSTNATGISIAAGRTLSANSGNNNPGATISNAGTLTVLGGLANFFGATLNTDAATSIVNGGLTNSGTVNARNQINGAISNNRTGTITITGNLAGNSTFDNLAASQLIVSGGDFTGITTLTNDSTSTTGVSISAGRTLSATSLVNAAGATINNLGTITTNSTINDGTITGAYAMAGGTLSGVGSVQNLAVNGGTFAPGNGTPGSSMNVTTSLSFQSAAIFMVQVNPATASFANVTGTATLGGATVSANFATGSYVSKQYTIVQATGLVSGTFNPTVVNTSLPPNFSTSLSYDAHDAYLNLTLNFTAPNFGSGLNGNQQNVGNALIGFFNSTGGIPLVFGALTPAGLSQASGETATGTQQTTFDAMTQFMGIMTDPFIGGRGDGFNAGSGATPFAEEFDAANAYAAKDRARSQSERDAYAAIYRKAQPMAAPFIPGWSVWAAGFGGSQTTDGNTTVGSNSTTSRLGGVAVGADYRFSPNTIAGFALAGGGTSFSVNGFGTGRSDLFQAGAFVRHTVGPAYFTAALAYGWQDITTDRTVTIAGIDQLRARFNANAFSGRIEDGYRFATAWMGVTPYAAAQFTTFDLPAYAEQAIVGANTFALAYGAKSVTDTRSEIGVRADKSWAMPDSIFTLRGRFAWAHDYNDGRSIGATFQTLPGASFVVNGAAQSADKALTTASAEVKWRSGFSLAATFEGEFSGNSSSYAGKGVARYQW